MSIAKALGWNEVDAFLAPRSNTLLGLGAGLLSGNLGNVPLYAMEGRKADDAYATQQKAEAERQRQINATTKWLQDKYPDLAGMIAAGMPISDAWSTALQRMQPQGGQALTSDIQNYEYAQAHPGFADWQTQKGGQAEMSLQPTWLEDEQHRVWPGQMTKDGRVVLSQVPEGMTVVPPADMAGAKAGATVDAKTAAAARAALPGAQQTMTIAENAINLLRSDEKGLNEQFGNTFGVPNRNLYVYPGSALGNWQANFAQAKGQAFMQARNMLKGGGQITDYEGRMGEAAYSRMEQAAASGDKETFLRALDDFEAAVKDGYAKLMATANGEYAAGQPGAGGGDLKSRYGLE